MIILYINEYVFLPDRQAAKMDKVMHELGNTLSDQDVNAVASQHFDAQQVNTKYSLAVLKEGLPRRVPGALLKV